MSTPKTYTKGESVRVDGCPGWTYVEPYLSGTLHVLKNHHGQSFQIVESRISSDVQPEQAAKKSLGEIACEEAFGLLPTNATAFNWINSQNHYKHGWEEVARAVKATVLAEQKPSEDVQRKINDLAFIFNHAKRFSGNAGYDFDKGAGAAYKWVTEHLEPLMPIIFSALKQNQLAPVYKTSERKPTKEDADTNDYVLAWMNTKTSPNPHWQACFWQFVVANSDTNTFWQPMPPAPPVETEPSEEEKAFQEWLLKLDDIPPDTTPCRQAWKAAISYAKEQQNK